MNPVERDTQLDRFERLLDDCLGGRGGTLTLTGPAACGKTELLRALGTAAEARGALVLTATARCAERSVRFGVLHQLLRSPGLPPQERAAALALLDLPGAAEQCQADPPGTGRVPLRVDQELWLLLHDLAARTPLVLAVDDLRYADPESRQTLIHLATWSPTAPVLLVVTEPDPPSDSGADRDWWTALLRLPHLTRLRADRLGERGTAQLLAGLLGVPAALPSSWLHSWYELTGGNPLLLRALAEDCAADGPSARPVPGPAFALAVRACLHRVGAGAAEPARALAVLAESGSTDLLPQLLGGPAPEALAALEAAGLVADGRLRGAAVARAVLDGLPEAERTARHLRAARLVYESGAAAESVAAHLLAARDATGPWALPVLLDAGRAALRRDDHAFAEACLALAAAAAPGEAEVALLRGVVRFRTDPRAAYRLIRPLAHGQVEMTDRQRTGFVRMLSWHGTEAEIAGTLTALAPADAADRDELTRSLEQLRAIAPHLVPPGHPAPPPGLPAGEPQQRSALALPRVLRSGGTPDDLRTAELVLRTTPLDDTTYGSLQSALYVLVYADRADLAAPWCAGLLREVTARRIPVWQALLTATMAEIKVRLGEASAAEQLARQALELLPPSGWGVWLGAPLSALMLATAALGAAPELERQLPALPDRLVRTRYGAQFLHARGRHRLATGAADAALEDFTRCGRLLEEWGLDLPSFLPWRSDAARALLALRRPQQARALALAQLGHPGAGRPRTRGLTLRVLAACDPARRIELLREAVELLEDCGDRAELAWALAELGEALLAAGQRPAGREALRQALGGAEELGLVPLLARLKGVAEEDDPAGLSASERRVAELAAAGHSNREIAERLFITVSTVEQHLTHTYRKLRVKGRAELARSLGAPAGERHTAPRRAARPTGAQGATVPRASRSRRVSSA
ncbi:AAA family ATPase [Kitasatospora viridis]|uniref:Regulatory LuxR family protein n=1 Tax=Kitasatospora viridis TaxID=281105 RepID=A0A561SFR1_9ACTN|nr:LuxR family transcriptional regulator [Kitasatospora viridis]TWF73637.1 regulatory LuxR family protein [Kitasatospora viridis]